MPQCPNECRCGSFFRCTSAQRTSRCTARTYCSGNYPTSPALFVPIVSTKLTSTIRRAEKLTTKTPLMSTICLFKTKICLNSVSTSQLLDLFVFVESTSANCRTNLWKSWPAYCIFPRAKPWRSTSSSHSQLLTDSIAGV